MSTLYEPSEHPESIAHDLLEELQKAEENLVHAQKSMCEPTDLRHCLRWCGRHMRRARTLSGKLLRSNRSF